MNNIFSLIFKVVALLCIFPTVSATEDYLSKDISSAPFGTSFTLRDKVNVQNRKEMISTICPYKAANKTLTSTLFDVNIFVIYKVKPEEHDRFMKKGRTIFIDRIIYEDWFYKENNFARYKVFPVYEKEADIEYMYIGVEKSLILSLLESASSREKLTKEQLKRRSVALNKIELKLKTITFENILGCFNVAIPTAKPM